jgi:molybdopterin-guanine dinucleotide biosynthesis protein
VAPSPGRCVRGRHRIEPSSRQDREYPTIEEPTFDQLVAELVECDWVLVEGFKHAPLPKIEVWRAATGKPAQYPFDPFVIAVATDSEAAFRRRPAFRCSPRRRRRPSPPSSSPRRAAAATSRAQ